MDSCSHSSHPKEPNLEISYISDIHLEERFIQERCKTEGDRFHVLQRIARTIGEQSTQVNLIAGDTADSVETFSLFVQQLSVFSKGDFFFVLGNHEYAGWSQKILLAPTNTKLAEIEQAYKVVIEQYGQQRMHLVQNNLFFLGKDCVWREVTKAELANLSPAALRDAVKDSILMIFGGVNMRTFEQKTFSSSETDYSFFKRKVTQSLNVSNLILLTHGIDEESKSTLWADDIQDSRFIEISDVYQDEAILVCGHTHHNETRNDGKKRIYADNQIAHHGKVFGLKKFTLQGRPDYFEKYEDGIYDISGKDYFEFYRGIGVFVPRYARLDRVTMVKRNGRYAFVLQVPSGHWFLLDFDNFLGIGEATPKEIFLHMECYFDSLGMFLSDYGKALDSLASEIRFLDGNGKTHGCIIDIDRENHLFLNPFDFSIVPYSAKTTKERYVFPNVPSLLRAKCPPIFRRYRRMRDYYQTELSEISINGSAVPSKESFVETGDEMYKISKAVSFAQFSLERGILRFWMDALADRPSKHQGEYIVKGMAFAKRRKTI